MFLFLMNAKKKVAAETMFRILPSSDSLYDHCGLEGAIQNP